MKRYILGVLIAFGTLYGYKEVRISPIQAQGLGIKDIAMKKPKHHARCAI